MIGERYDFSLSESDEDRAARIHRDSIVIDLLFQGPIGTYSLGEEIERETLELARAHCEDLRGQLEYATNLIREWSISGKLVDLYKQCWYESGLTAGNR